MVKADYSRDYYADLELPQNADINDIKRQFRKLAFKYHPDRNPGREAEANSKFQTIQTAHEILASPESKSKYDANRARYSRFPSSSGVRGNPWQDVAKDFPPPPQRNRPNMSSRSSASAARYAKFPNTPPPPPPRAATKEDARAHADAFESMRGAHTRRPAPTAAASPRTSSPSGASARPRPTPDPRQTAYTASQQKKAEASFGTRTPRASRSGFAPGSPMGDEGPVSSKHYATKRHTSLFDESATAYQRTNASAEEEDDGGPMPYLDPRSSPYRGVRGEKLDPFDGVANLGRTRSTREIPRKPVGGADSDPFVARSHRQRSFSVSDEPDNPNKSAADDVRRGSAAASGGSWSGAANTSSSRMPPSPISSRFGDRYTPRTGGGAFQFNDDSSSSGASAAATVGADSGNISSSKAKNGQPSVYPTAGHRSDESLAPNGNQSRFTRNSADNINTRFVAEEHANTNWQFSAGGDAGEDANGSSARRSQSQSANRSGRRSPGKGRASSRMNPGTTAAAAAAAAAGVAAGAFAGSGGASTSSEAADPKQQPGFDADEWKHQIGSEHFVPVPPPRTSTSPTRQARPAKRRPTIRVTKGGTAGLVDDDDTTSGEEKPAGAPLDGRRPGSPNAMDIDTPMAEAVPSPQPNGVRTVPLEPSRPEWRAGDTNSFITVPSPGSGASPNPGIGLGLNLGPSAVPPLPPKVPVAEKPRFNASNTVGSEDTDELRTSFADFKNVEPIAERATGLSSFDDLKTNLPFESKASATAPVENAKPKVSKTVHFPKAPVPPRAPPALAIPSLLPAKQAWDKYVTEFEVYLREWDEFNAKFVDHVLARQNNMDRLKQKTGLGPLFKRGDEGLQEYYAGLEEDKIVHEKWTAYTTEHLHRVREFTAHRDKMKLAL